ncbi:hypothetical protein [Sinomonas albida]|uniref:hypothetical protein n=1 Tax=Sinomonas albida TaxID=369942 RepID=UPI003015AB10
MAAEEIVAEPTEEKLAAAAAAAEREAERARCRATREGAEAALAPLRQRLGDGFHVTGAELTDAERRLADAAAEVTP